MSFRNQNVQHHAVLVDSPPEVVGLAVDFDEDLIDVADWQQAGLVFEWTRGWDAGSQVNEAGDGFPRYAVTDGMTAVAKHLAETLTIHNQTQLVRISQVEEHWQALAADGRSYQARALLLTPPVPQSLALLDAGDVSLSPTDRAALERIQYAPCLSGLFWIEGEVTLPAPGAVQRPEQPISWIADNQQKGISPEATIITAHANPTMSQLWYEAPKGELVGLFMGGIRPYLGKDSVSQGTPHSSLALRPAHRHP